jgi:hypothetical protein
MKTHTMISAVLLALSCAFDLAAQDRPYLTTQSPITVFSTNDGEVNQLFQLTDEQTTDWELKTKDSFTVIHLGPDHPPIIRTIYDTVPCSILGTPTMAMSSDGRYALIANHSWRRVDDPRSGRGRFSIVCLTCLRSGGGQCPVDP